MGVCMCISIGAYLQPDKSVQYGFDKKGTAKLVHLTGYWLLRAAPVAVARRCGAVPGCAPQGTIPWSPASGRVLAHAAGTQRCARAVRRWPLLESSISSAISAMRGEGVLQLYVRIRSKDQ
eukprot:4783363-Prymnesium_polylepis.3